MKQQTPQPATEPATAPKKKTREAIASPLAAAFDRVAQKSGFDNWKQLDREQPLPTRSASPAPATDPDAKPEPPRISGKQAAAGQGGADVSFTDFVKGAHRLPSSGKRG